MEVRFRQKLLDIATEVTRGQRRADPKKRAQVGTDLAARLRWERGLIWQTAEREVQRCIATT